MSAETHLARVGAAQVDACLGQPKANLQRHLDFIQQARGRQIDLLVFPETSLTGFPHQRVHAESLRRDAPVMEQLAAAAGDMTVVFGFVEEAPAAQFYNSCLVVRDAQTVHLHHKLNLATYGCLEEGKYFAQGRYVEAFELPDNVWRISTLICADVWNPALVHLAALHGATMLAVPINSAKDAVSSEFSNPAGWDLVTRFYAMIYGMPIIMANRVGTEAGLTFWGGSRVVDAFGEVLVEADGSSEVLIDTEVDFNSVRQARIQLPTVRDSNLALLSREVARLEQLIGVPSNLRR